MEQQIVNRKSSFPTGVARILGFKPLEWLGLLRLEEVSLKHNGLAEPNFPLLPIPGLAKTRQSQHRREHPVANSQDRERDGMIESRGLDARREVGPERGLGRRYGAVHQVKPLGRTGLLD